ncbi:MAG TPA: glycosyltransferase family 4 protein [Candidatus Kapabacteria bacterium]|nr:glycosyltransferase family 4 protein [Candidatus Kapabacteria bacterium]
MPKRRVSLLFLGDPTLDRRIQSFAEMFRASGYDVRMYFSIPGQTAVTVLDESIQLPSRYASGPRMFLGHHAALRKHLSEISRSDVIVACDLYSLRAAAQAKRGSTRSILLYDARELYTGLPAVAKRPFIRYFWKKWEAGGMLDADFISITAPHDADAIFRVHSFLPRPLLIRNIPLREKITPDRKYLQSLGMSERENVAVYVGGLQQDRGLEGSIRALKHCEASVKLLLLGSGSLESPLKELAKTAGVASRVIFAGAVAQESVMPILAACDVGLSLIEANSPSYSLALPSKVFEYLHAGLPVISTELKHVIELFDHQPYIRYVQPIDERAIANAITAFLGKKQELSAIIEQAASQYSFESDFESLRVLLDERLAERR